MPFGNHTLLLSLEGGLWAFGENSGGQLGLGHTENQVQPMEVPWDGAEPVQVDWGYEHSLVLDAEGVVWEAGVPNPSFRGQTFQQVKGCLLLLRLLLVTLTAPQSTPKVAFGCGPGIRTSLGRTLFHNK